MAQLMIKDGVGPSEIRIQFFFFFLNYKNVEHAVHEACAWIGQGWWAVHVMHAKLNVLY